MNKNARRPTLARPPRSLGDGDDHRPKAELKPLKHKWGEIPIYLKATFEPRVSPCILNEDSRRTPHANPPFRSSHASSQAHDHALPPPRARPHARPCTEATAGMRELPDDARARVMAAVRGFLTDPATCPFLLRETEAARVISGEEEAAYAWVGVNYVSGALLNDSWGFGTAGSADLRVAHASVDGLSEHNPSVAFVGAPHSAFGTLEMGGASAQIAFFRPEQDVLANLFKAQHCRVD